MATGQTRIVGGIVPKKSSVPGKIPTGTTLGEIFSNLSDRKLWGYDGSNMFEYGSSSFLGLTGGTVTGSTNFTSSVTASTLTARLVKRISTVSSSATPALNTDVTDIARLTGLTSNITNASTNLTGTPLHGDLFSYEITDNGVARTISWGASFSNTGTLSLPTTTVISTLLRCLFQYNSITGKWEIIAVV